MSLNRVVIRNAHVKYERTASYVLKVMSNVKVVRYVGQMSLGKKYWYKQKGLDLRNIHVKYLRNKNEKQCIIAE